MKACVDAAATAASKDMKTETEDEKKGWVKSCMADAQAEFEAAGGKPGDFEMAKRKGVEAKGADKMKTCVDAAATAASKDMKTATEEEKKGWVKSCMADAKAEFEAAGGKAGDFEMAKRKGAESKGADKMKTCVDAAATAASKDMKTAT